MKVKSCYWTAAAQYKEEDSEIPVEGDPASRRFMGGMGTLKTEGFSMRKKRKTSAGESRRKKKRRTKTQDPDKDLTNSVYTIFLRQRLKNKEGRKGKRRTGTVCPLSSGS